ncbi:MAG: hypothetical protein IT551_08870, partial [Novosphingobium sp.]|nr:hypothetical protein [Novosphingobium sp.]
MNFLTDRRSVLLGAGALGATGLLGLSGKPLRAQTAPQKGGTFRFAIADFNSGETLAPQVNETKFMQCLQFQIRNSLIELGPGGVLVPELATEWEGNDDSTVWVFKLRQGVEFHDGRPFTAEDAVYSLNLHRGADTISTIKGMLEPIIDAKATDKYEMTVTLSAPNSGLPSLFTMPPMLVVPAGETDLDKGVGTGGYVLEVYEPGVKASTVHNPNYWKEGRAH